jgi:glutathione S-transferase
MSDLPEPGDRMNLQPKLALYFAPTTCSLVPWITLTEAGAVFETRTVNMRKRDQMTPEFLRLNPKHRVPVLLIDDQPLTENVAIQLWIAQAFPAARLMPADPLDHARATSLLAWCASGIHPTLTPNALPDRYCDLPDSAESVRRCARKLLLENMAIADERLAGREWFFDHFTSADAYFFWCVRKAKQFGIDLGEQRHVTAHFERMRQRPSVSAYEAYEAQIP